MNRREEIRKIHKKYRFLYEMMAGAAVLVVCVLAGAGAFGGENVDYRMNLFTEGMGIVATVFIINRWYAHRERTSLQSRLIREAGSRSHDIAISAVEWMDREGWLRGEEGLLSGANLGSAQFGRARLAHANLNGADLRFADLRRANLERANLRDARLCMADLTDAILNDADLAGADVTNAKMCGAGLPGANLEQISGVKANLSNTHLMDAVIRDANLKLADLQGASLWGADFAGANLLYAKLDNIKEAKRAKWERANLARVDLRAMDFEKANLKGAILRCADLRNANLSGTNLENADLYGAYLQDANVQFWPTVPESRAGDFAGRIIIGINDTEYPETNLVGARLPDGTLFTEGSDLLDIQRFIFPSDPRFVETMEIIERIRAY